MRGHAEVQSRFLAIALDFFSQFLDWVPRALRGAHHRAALLFLVALAALPLFSQAQTVVIGSQQIQPQSDSNSAGQAEAFKATASASGSIVSISVYVDSGSTASKLVAGLYTDAAGKPGTLLTQGTLNGPVAGAWNTVTVPSAQITPGANYWFAILAPAQSGTLKFRDKFGGGSSQTSAALTLTTLPSSWTTGTMYTDGPLSAYATASGSIQPILSVSPTSLSFTYTQGAAPPAPASLSVTNTGTGTLIFNASASGTWLSVSPASGTAPQSEQVTAAVSGLPTGTYMGQVTISAGGAQNSPVG